MPFCSIHLKKNNWTVCVSHFDKCTYKPLRCVFSWKNINRKEKSKIKKAKEKYKWYIIMRILPSFIILDAHPITIHTQTLMKIGEKKYWLSNNRFLMQNLQKKILWFGKIEIYFWFEINGKTFEIIFVKRQIHL